MMPAHSSGASAASSNAVGQRVDEVLGRDDVVGVAAVGVPAREQRRDAQVLGAALAEAARAAGAVEPRHADAVAVAEALARPAPRPATRPTTSCPGTTCGRRGARSPSATCRSVRHTPHTSTATSSSPGAGSGRGRSTSRSGRSSAGRGASTSSARISRPRARSYGRRPGSALPAETPRPGTRPRRAQTRRALDGPRRR